MVKRNKGGSNKRQAQLDKQRMQKDLNVMQEILAFLADYPLDHAHQLVFSILRSLEAAMEERGIKIPNYIEHRINGTVADRDPEWIRCKRCELVFKDHEGCWRCSDTWVGPDKDHLEQMYCSEGDGCGRGILRKEYK